MSPGTPRAGVAPLAFPQALVQALALSGAPKGPGKLGGSRTADWTDLPRLCPLPSARRLRECSFRPEHMSRLAAGLSQAWHLTELT